MRTSMGGVLETESRVLIGRFDPSLKWTAAIVDRGRRSPSCMMADTATERS